MLRVEAEDKMLSFPGDVLEKSEFLEEPEELLKTPLLGLPSFESRRGTPSDRVVSMEKVDPTLFMPVRVSLGMVTVLFDNG